MIHSTAIIDPKARLASDVRVGPYAVIDADVEIGPGCIIGPYAYVTGRTTLGARNKLFPGAVLGEAPQDLKYRGEPSELLVGDDNTFREHVTVHRSNKPGHPTIIGSNNLLMAGCHIGHDCELGNRVIIANGALFGGHVVMADAAFVSGNCLVHQFARIGTLAMMQGGSAISKDLPPFTVVRGANRICGLNTVGLRRAGLTAAERLELRKLYHLLFRSRVNLKEAVAQAAEQFTSQRAKVMLDFIRTARRGVCMDRSRGVSIEATDFES